MIKPVVAKTFQGEDYGDILYGSEYVSHTYDFDKLESIKSEKIGLISLIRPDPWHEAERLNVDLSKIRDKVIYECPYIIGNRYFWMIPTAIIVKNDVDQYRKPNFDSAMFEYKFDASFVLNGIRVLSHIERASLGHGYTTCTLPCDGDNELKRFLVNLDNGDQVIFVGWVWYNK